MKKEFLIFSLVWTAAVFVVAGLLSCSSTNRFSRNPDSATRPQAATFSCFVDVNQERMMRAIQPLKNIPYKWGGMSMTGMDCSGFVKKVYWDAERIDLPHSSKEQAGYGKRVRPEDLRMGDLVFFKINGFSIDHVGLYIGDGKFAHASLTQGVTVTPFDDPYYSARFVLAKRLYFE